MPSLQDFEVNAIDGTPLDLQALRGRVVLIVNTASACGFTPQFAGLQKLHDAFAERGLSIIGFPCNQFGGQDPADNPQILAYCQRNYGVTFAMAEKIDVNGSQAHPLFKWLKKEGPGLLGSELIKWNFTKFLIDREGRVVRRYAPNDDPARLMPDIEALL